MKRYAPTLILGDCLEVMRKMKADSVDLVVTDPPYRVISGGNKTKHKAGWNVSVLKANDGKIFKHNAIKVIDYMRELYRVLKPGRDCYVMTNNLTLHELLDAAKEVGFKFHNLLFWVKNTANANRWYMKNVELTVYLYKPPARTINFPGSKQTFYANNPRNKRHPTEKPVSLMKHYIANSIEPGWIVLDPFMGSGSTGVAAMACGANFIGVDLDEQYHEIAVRRVSKAHKKLETKTAKLSATKDRQERSHRSPKSSR